MVNEKTNQAARVKLNQKGIDMKVEWNDVKEDYARKDAQILELVEALEEIADGGREIDDIALMKDIAESALAKAKSTSN